MTEIELRDIFLSIWCRETSSFPEEWTPENPAVGQCLGTARITRDLLGGVMLQSLINRKWPHYYNRLPSGKIIDLTEEQLPAGAVISAESEANTSFVRAMEEFFPEVRRRYEVLARKFEEHTGIYVLD